MHVVTHYKHALYLALFLFTTLSSTHSAFAGNWPHWRGPQHNGAANESNLPASWSTTNNVAWSTKMPGPSEATPIVMGDRVFLVSNDTSLTKLYAICLDRKTGKILWNNLLSDKAQASSRGTMAASSPASDGKLVFFMFGNGDLFALDLEGNTIWSQNLGDDYGPFIPLWGYSSSPTLYKNRLYITVMRGTPSNAANSTDENSYLLCLDPATGNVIFKHHRTSDAQAESQDSYTTPIPFETTDGQSQIVLAGADYITGHDATTGKEIWRHANNPRKIKNWRLIPSPVVAGNIITGVVPRGGNAFAINPSGGSNMAYEEAAWIFDKRTTDVPSPLFYDGRLYILNGTRKVMMCVDPASGKEIWSGDLGGNATIWSSPTASDGKIYCMNEAGTTFVLQAGDTFKILSESELGGSPSKSSIAIADDSLFIRTAEALYCIASSGK